jgi:hypothetical protein
MIMMIMIINIKNNENIENRPDIINRTVEISILI